MTSILPWEILLVLLKSVYALCMVIFFVYGVNTLFLAWTYLRHRSQLPRAESFPPPRQWPKVTVQLPIYNEGRLIERLLRTITRLDYPRDRLEIQVLDDSTDETSLLARALVERYRREGYDITYRHRPDRQGYKAGNLASGLQTASGDLIAIFDADFIPPRNWLKRVVPAFQDPRIGFVQTRWVHYNAHTNLLTRLVALAMDGHAIVEQGGRAAGGFFVGFDGSGGIWRRRCIEEAGGWHWDTLTEDLDLAYRAQLLGWKALYLPDVIVQSEVPVTLDALRRQQYRWAKGSLQTFRKLGLKLLRADLPWLIRLQGLLHLSMYLPFPFAILAFLLVLPLGMWTPSYFTAFFWSILGGVGLAVEYLTAETETNPHFRDRLALLPGMLILGIGIGLTCAIGAIDGLLHNGGVFERTPKSITLKSGSSEHSPKRATVYNYLRWGEIGMSIYSFVALVLIILHGHDGLVPWLASSFLSFLTIAEGSLLEEPLTSQVALPRSRHRSPSLPG